MNFSINKDATLDLNLAIESNTIYILAIMHLHRSPDYWKTRV